MRFPLLPSLLVTLATALAAAIAPLPAQEPEPLVVCATTPNLGALVREVAGPDSVDLRVFCKPSQDPHFLRALPSFVKQLNQADLLLVVGLDLESGWIPTLIDQARNPRVRRGAPGYFDASVAIRPLGVPTTAVDRASGDVHFRGNPHYLVDPVSGALVADAIAARLGELRPVLRETFAANAADLRRRLGAVLVGAELASTYDFTKLVRLYQAGRLEDFLRTQEDLDRLTGALRDFAKLRGAPVIADHDAWRYLTGTLGLRIVGYLEPRPGIPPSTSHLKDLVETARADHPRALLHVMYFEPRSIGFVVDATGVKAVELAHQVGALPDTGDYVGMVRENLARLSRAVSEGSGSRD